MRKQLLGVVLPLLILGMIAAAAETQNTGTDATTHAALQRLNVVSGEDGISLEITARGAVTPKLITLSSPARVVIDLPNTVALTDQRHVEVESDGVKDVRVGMNGQVPPSTRVVVDLEKACKFELVPGADNKIVVKLHTGAATAKTATKPSETVTAAMPKAVPAGSPFGAKLVTASTVVEKKEVAANVPATTPVPAPKPVETAASKLATDSAKRATDYVFVEPSYQAKDDAKSDATPAIEPAERATEAAAKFVDKPASELMTSKTSASMQPQAAQAASTAI